MYERQNYRNKAKNTQANLTILGVYVPNVGGEELSEEFY